MAYWIRSVGGIGEQHHITANPHESRSRSPLPTSTSGGTRTADFLRLHVSLGRPALRLDGIPRAPERFHRGASGRSAQRFLFKRVAHGPFVGILGGLDLVAVDPTLADRGLNPARSRTRRVSARCEAKQSSPQVPSRGPCTRRLPRRGRTLRSRGRRGRGQRVSRPKFSSRSQPTEEQRTPRKPARTSRSPAKRLATRAQAAGSDRPRRRPQPTESPRRSSLS